MNAPDPTLLTPAEVAKRLGVSPITVRSWATKGWLAARATPGGHRRFRWEDVERLLLERGRSLLERGRSKVLVVDDDPQFRAYLVEMLSLLDGQLEIREAVDGFQAGLAMAEFHPDLVLLDYSMPGMDGAEVCRMLKAKPESAATRVVALTGLADPVVAQKMRDAGADEVVFKPAQPNRIREALAALGFPSTLAAPDTATDTTPAQAATAIPDGAG